MDAAFDLQTEVANLAERIVGPVAVKLAQKELNAALGEIRNAFEQLSAKSPPAHDDFKNVALNILEPVRAKLSEADFARIADRLRGAMVGFCQSGGAKVQFDAEPWWLQQAGLHAQSEPETAMVEYVRGSYVAAHPLMPLYSDRFAITLTATASSRNERASATAKAPPRLA